jgi:predicted TPR repeat methyltransferase
MSSGDLAADRRLEAARGLRDSGDLPAALSVLAQALEIAPGWAEAWFLFGEWSDENGRRDEAVAAYSRVLALDPADRLGAIIRLALIGAAPQPRVLPPAYVAAVFDEYAPRFDTALTGALGYQVPGTLHAALIEAVGPDAGFGSVLDLGCGTGLAGERFRTSASWLEGVDLSPGIIREAERRRIYDALHVGDMSAYLAAAAKRYDLVIAADALVYVGDLAPMFRAVSGVLAPGGRFAFSCERMADAGSRDGGYRLTAGHRYVHAPGYLADCLAAAGLVIEASREIVCRLEAGRPVEGCLVISRSPEAVAHPAVPDLAAAVPEPASDSSPVPPPLPN